MSEHVTIFEMGPRDGLQNEKVMISTADKVRLVDSLSKSGFKKIEVTSFVSPKWVPQMADAAEVLASIKRKPDVSYTVLTPNMRGFEAACQSDVDEIAVFASASEGFSRKNINCTITESLERFKPVIEAANVNRLPVRGYVSCITDCPYEGAVSPQQVAEVSRQLLEMGCYEVSLGDTIGSATPEKVESMLTTVLTIAPPERFAGHFHDTKGRALSNIDICLEKGLRVFDSSVGGLGGCPYAPGAKGNVATELVVKHLEERGFETGIDREELEKVVRFAKLLRGRNQ